ncbi:MAG: peptidoglycan-binding protein [Acidimicrobiia bacterium]
MRLYRQGDTGSPVRDIQERLASLQLPYAPDEAGVFGGATADAVTSFQRSRGLAQDGIVGPDTWRALVEASYHLGDRLLYLRRPMIRGEDVGELQRQLNALGFDAGNIDGIFGGDTASAVLDFQRNRGMATDGIAGPEVISELRGIVRATRKAGRVELREREWLRSLPRSLVGTRIFLDPACVDVEETAQTWEVASQAAHRLQALGAAPLLSRSADTPLPPRIRARRANRAGVDVVVSVEVPRDQAEGVFFFASALSYSEAGAALAGAIADQMRIPTEGRATVILKETRAPAAVLCLKNLDAAIGTTLVAGIVSFFNTDYGLENSVR